MSNANPYSAPQEPANVPARPLPGARLLFASLGVTALATVGGAALGLGGGFVAGNLAPGYYASEGRSAGEAVLMAMGIGLGQGLGGGCVTGIVLVALFYAYRAFLTRRDAISAGSA